MPKPGTLLKLENLCQIKKHPFTIYADTGLLFKKVGEPKYVKIRSYRIGCIIFETQTTTLRFLLIYTQNMILLLQYTTSNIMQVDFNITRKNLCDLADCVTLSVRR